MKYYRVTEKEMAKILDQIESAVATVGCGDPEYDTCILKAQKAIHSVIVRDQTK